MPGRRCGQVGQGGSLPWVASRHTKSLTLQHPGTSQWLVPHWAPPPLPLQRLCPPAAPRAQSRSGAGPAPPAAAAAARHAAAPAAAGWRLLPAPAEQGACAAVRGAGGARDRLPSSRHCCPRCCGRCCRCCRRSRRPGRQQPPPAAACAALLTLAGTGAGGTEWKPARTLRALGRPRCQASAAAAGGLGTQPPSAAGPAPVLRPAALPAACMRRWRGRLPRAVGLALGSAAVTACPDENDEGGRQGGRGLGAGRLASVLVSTEKVCLLWSWGQAGWQVRLRQQSRRVCCGG